VLINEETGQVKVAYRGTDTTNPKDLATDLLSIRSLEKSSPEYSYLKDQIKSIERVYGFLPEELIGFSRGSVLSMNLGNEFKIPTTQFNPLISKGLVEDINTSSHHIYATTGDPVSYKLYNNSHWIVDTIKPVRDTLNPFEEHNLSQFTIGNDVPRRTDDTTLNLRRFQIADNIQSEYIMVDAIRQTIERGGTFTDFLKEFSPVDVNGNSFSRRVFKGSNFTSFWEEQGGTFTPKEVRLIQNNDVGTIGTTETTKQQRINYFNSSETEREAINENLNEQRMALADAIDNNYKPSAEANLYGLSSRTSTAIVEALGPTNIAKGFIGAEAGALETAEINNLYKDITGSDINPVVQSGLAGGLGGVNTALISSATRGALSGAEFATELTTGAVGGIIAYVSQEAIYHDLINSGANEATAQSVSMISGGAIGGATTAVVGAGVSTAVSSLSVPAGYTALATSEELAIEAGAEVGSAFAPETLGLSVLVGAGLGALAGGAIYASGQIAGFGQSVYNQAVHPIYDPYDVGPAPMSFNQQDTIKYLNRQAFYQNLQAQDQAQGITPEQRIQMGIPQP